MWKEAENDRKRDPHWKSPLKSPPPADPHYAHDGHIHHGTDAHDHHKPMHVNLVHESHKRIDEARAELHDDGNIDHQSSCDTPVTGGVWEVEEQAPHGFAI